MVLLSTGLSPEHAEIWAFQFRQTEEGWNLWRLSPGGEVYLHRPEVIRRPFPDILSLIAPKVYREAM